MGTTLTGTTPQDTYDSLIKVTDNGPLSGTAKYLSDGLGNDSVLALSTSKVGIATNTPAVELHVETSGTGTTAMSNVITTLRSKAAGRDIDIQFSDGTNQAYIGSLSGAFYIGTGGANERMRITSTGNVGIGTTTPTAKIHTLLSGNASSGIAGSTIVAQNSSSGANSYITLVASFSAEAGIAFTDESELHLGRIVYDNNTESMRFLTNGTEKVRILSGGGITFNGDTAAANALDDYEEGTFTATAAPSTSGTITLSVNTCSYTKIGRQVTIKGQLVVGSVASPIGTLVTIAGLPFTSINSVSGRGSGTATYFPSVGSGSLALNYQLQNAAEWNLVLTAATIAAGDEFYITLTYFV
jgi:hypothetical protein